MDTPFTYDPKAALSAVLYVASRIPDPTFHKVATVLYFADRKHLERYGRLIFGDSYVATKHGPVPSGVYDLLKSARVAQPQTAVPSPTFEALPPPLDK
jgi:uncharacterized phage-associated protein